MKVVSFLIALAGSILIGVGTQNLLIASGSMMLALGVVCAVQEIVNSAKKS